METWRLIKNYRCLYKVSTHGRVKSKHSGVWKLLSLGKTPNGYATVTLCKNGRCHTRTVHRVVALTFLPNPNNLPCINHKDSNRKNNYTTNLEWCSHSQNLEHAILNGRQGSAGQSNPKCKLTWKKVRRIRNLYEAKTHNQKQLAIQFGVCQTNISAILKRKTWVEYNRDCYASYTEE